MDPKAYKEICDRPNVLSRSNLESTLAAIEDDLPEVSVQLKSLLAGPSIEKPFGHKGNKEADFLIFDYLKR